MKQFTKETLRYIIYRFDLLELKKKEKGNNTGIPIPKKREIILKSDYDEHIMLM